VRAASGGLFYVLKEVARHAAAAVIQVHQTLAALWIAHRFPAAPPAAGGN